MNCTNVQPLLDAYADGELDAANARSIEQHLEHCRTCTSRFQEIHRQSALLRQHLPRHTAPPGLESKILNGLSPQTGVGKARLHSRRLSRWLTGVAASLLAVLGIALVIQYREETLEAQRMEAVVAGHTQAIHSNRLTDVTSNDVQVIRPWLLSRLNYAPRIFDLADAGYPILGARLDRIEQIRVAAISYQYGDHVINVYTWPSPDVEDAVREAHTLHGYNLVYWCNRSMNYWIVSDLDMESMSAFAQRLQDRLETAARNSAGEAAPARP